ncbi:SLAM family member 9-like [Eublepharis macularius]|uniref:SLAM family member 9-like n=1 Tax=Eublepharis macularius TaxID=481883 RepID=A0AA97K275_EUBMA|nr:SLAM family member 9-like [Eublepharis macularius]
MDACSPIGLFIFALLLQAAGMGTAEGAPRQDLTHRVGESATFSLEVLQQSNISNLLWRSSSRGPMQAVAAWQAGNPLEVLSESYSGRVTFLEQSLSLKISNLSKDDGGFYNVVEFQDEGEALLKEYILFIFDVRITASRSANGTCSLRLLCEVGAGAKTTVKFNWRPTLSKGPGSQGPALHLVLHPADADKSYTCTAAALGSQQSVAVIPYQSCNSGARAAGLLWPGSLAGPIAETVLGPAFLALLVLL